MRVIRADVLGMCFGVRDALKIIDEIDRPESVTIHGELVHNEAVLERLDARGFHQADEKNRLALPMTDTVLITAHGISHKERQRLAAAGKRLVDTTCPLVERVHKAALTLQEEGYHVLVIGKRGHVEVQGVIGDLGSFHVVQGPEEAQTYPFSRLGIVCQTTATAENVERVRAAVAERNPLAEIRFIDTVCLPTKEHQRALERLIEQVEAMVVVGGRNSNNTRELVNRCRAHGLPTYHVQDAADLEPDWFDGIETVGLTAGTSTLDETIEEVHDRLLSFANCAAHVGP
jgi:4-hydroxy-3-methylbut-2-en-1-yl diphosphate reductase